MSVYITNVNGKTVLDSNGAQIGRVSDVRVDKKGNLTEVLVLEDSPAGEQETPYLDYPKKNGVYKIPISNVQAVKDHILVE